MKTIAKTLIFLVFCIWLPALVAAETLYLWKDEIGNVHITKAAPVDSSRIIDTMTYTPQPVTDAD
jgi:hypothetical protein